MELRQFGEATLVGWRGRLADRVAAPIGRRTGFDEDQVRLAVGFVFFLLTIYYLLRFLSDLGGSRDGE